MLRSTVLSLALVPLALACEGEVSSSTESTGSAANALTVTLVPPSSHVALAPQVGDQIDAFYVGPDGAVNVGWVVDGNSEGQYFIWDGPVPITLPNKVPPLGRLAAAKQRDNQTDVFFVDNNGALNVTWVVDRGGWATPWQMTGINTAPPGGAVAAAKQRNNQLDLFYFGSDGQLHVMWVVDNGSGGNWQGPYAIPGAFAPAGAVIAAARQYSNQLDVFYIGNDGNIYHTWVVDNGSGGNWQGPLPRTSGGVAPPGGRLSAENQLSPTTIPFTNDSQLDVLYFGSDGALHVAWRYNTKPWQGPVAITNVGIAPPGAGVGLGRETPRKLDAFFVQYDGSAYMMTVQDYSAWSAPTPITLGGTTKTVQTDGTIKVNNANIGPPGASIAAGKVGNQMNVVFASGDGTPYASVFRDNWTSDEGKWWRRISPRSPGQTFPTGDNSTQWVTGSTTRLAQLTGDYDPEGLVHVNNTVPWDVEGVDLGTSADYGNTTIFLFGDVARYLRTTGGDDWDLMAYTTDSTPGPNGPHLTGVLNPNGTFYPFTVTRPSYCGGTITSAIGTNSTPSGAFTWEGKFYAFYWFDPGPYQGCDQNRGSYLAMTTNPTQAQPYTQLRSMSNYLAQVAPVVVNTADVPGLPVVANSSAGVVMLAQGTDDGIRLAYMPLYRGFMPSNSTLVYYYTDNGWSTTAPAKALWWTRGYSAVSLGYHPVARKWVVTYSKAWGISGSNESIVARVGTSPWSWSNEVTIFNPCREQAFGRYFHWPWLDPLHNRETWPDDVSWAYGAFLVNRYTQWDSVNHVLTLYFLLSPSRPYQVELMTTKIRTDIPPPGGSQ